MTNTVVSNNGGGGLEIQGARTTIDGCTIVGNLGAEAILYAGYHVRMTRNVVSGNSAGSHSAIWLYDGNSPPSMIDGNTIEGNSADSILRVEERCARLLLWCDHSVLDAAIVST